ncbi:hypothetical protein HDG34_005852 [Paraburkholderia sp. HC6.4b]|uniref:hypothetical protein n=1 Tax=unclassified Paraburkholderia TaxID=2615204 RepID=UPI0016137F90|nr:MULTISPECIES: hypothetical protein [unclassified Paraburkholderia]MBB5411886.1 hypothetical protein [Paraburkholderia sp. HC6.4b]MBB5450198.1 hypothetical protein [Paraburkholderia sp. Kb1A]
MAKQRGMDWLRWWHGTVTDPKFQWVARKSGQPVASVIAVWAALLECGSNATKCNADATRGNVASFDCDDIDVLFGLEEGVARSILSAMEAKRLIADGRIAKWEERQPQREDSGNPNTGALSSTERSQRLREKRKRDATQSNDMQRDATHATAMQRLEERRGEENIPPSGGDARARAREPVDNSPPESPPLFETTSDPAPQDAPVDPDVTDPDDPPPVDELAAILSLWEAGCGRRQAFGGVKDRKQLQAWIERDVKVEQLRAAHKLAAARRAEQNDPGPINLAFLDKFVDDVLAGASATGPPTEWWKTWPSLKAWGEERLVFQRDDEPDADFKLRVLTFAGDGPWWDDHFPERRRRGSTDAADFFGDAA